MIIVAMYTQNILKMELLSLRKVRLFINDQYSSRKQSKLYSTYYSKKSIDYSELRLSLETTAYQLGNQLRAFSFRQYQLPNNK